MKFGLKIPLQAPNNMAKMKRIIRKRRLTKEEAIKYNNVREQIAKDLPDLIAQYHGRMNMRPYPHKCPKCGNMTVEPTKVSRSINYQFKGNDVQLDIPALPVLVCKNCGLEEHTNDTDDCIAAAKNSQMSELKN